MKNYLIWDKKVIQDFSGESVSSCFENGFVFTRETKGSMYKTRSLRIDLSQFDLTSENRRVLNKCQDLNIDIIPLPIDQTKYDWRIHKLGKDFYENKLHLENTFSANKIKELITNKDESNFNFLFKYSIGSKDFGYAICFKNNSLLQYAYPFYDYVNFHNNYGMAMMLKVILFAKENGLKYIYLGSVSRPEDVYKLQFKGLMWFDQTNWQAGKIDELKQLISQPATF